MARNQRQAANDQVVRHRQQLTEVRSSLAQQELQAREAIAAAVAAAADPGLPQRAQELQQQVQELQAVLHAEQQESAHLREVVLQQQPSQAGQEPSAGPSNAGYQQLQQQLVLTTQELAAANSALAQVQQQVDLMQQQGRAPMGTPGPGAAAAAAAAALSHLRQQVAVSGAGELQSPGISICATPIPRSADVSMAGAGSEGGASAVSVAGSPAVFDGFALGAPSMGQARSEGSAGSSSSADMQKLQQRLAQAELRVQELQHTIGEIQLDMPPLCMCSSEQHVLPLSWLVPAFEALIATKASSAAC